MIGGLVLRLYTAADFFLHPWDEAFHAVVAKHMMQHPLIPTLYDTPILPYDYRNWAGNHIWVHKQPLPLWTMSASMYLFGVNEIALRLPSVILTTVGIWLTYYIGAYFFDRKTAFLAAFFYSVNGLIIEIAAGRVPTDHIDVFFLFFIELAIFFSIVFARKKSSVYNLLAGLSLGAAILSKWLPALIVLPMWLLIVIDSGNFNTKSVIIHFITLLVITLLTFMPWQIYIYHTFPLEAMSETNYNYRHMVEILDQQGGPVYYYLDKIRINYGELIYLPLIWFVLNILKDSFNLKRLAILIWFIVPLIFFSLIKSKMQGYLLFTSPALFMISSAFWYRLYTYKNDIKPENKIWLKWGISLLLIFFIILPVRYCLERVKPFKKDRSPQWVSDLKNMKQRNLKNAVLFNYSRPIDAMFYTDLTAYGNIPDTSMVKAIMQKGYTVLINDNGKIPTDIGSMKNIIPVHLAEPGNRLNSTHPADHNYNGQQPPSKTSLRSFSNIKNISDKAEAIPASIWDCFENIKIFFLKNFLAMTHFVWLVK